MIVNLRIVKRLADKTGESANGKWRMCCYVGEFTEDTPNGPSIHAVLLELSDKRWNVKNVDQLVINKTETPANIHLDIHEFEGRYFPDVSVYLRDPELLLPRDY